MRGRSPSHGVGSSDVFTDSIANATFWGPIVAAIASAALVYLGTRGASRRDRETVLGNPEAAARQTIIDGMAIYIAHLERELSRLLAEISRKDAQIASLQAVPRYHRRSGPHDDTC